MIKNPIPQAGLFAVPESAQALEDYIERFPTKGGQRITLYTVSGMTRNLCSRYMQRCLDEINRRDAVTFELLKEIEESLPDDSALGRRIAEVKASFPPHPKTEEEDAKV